MTSAGSARAARPSRTSRGLAAPGRGRALDSAAALNRCRPRSISVEIQYYFDALLVLVCVGVAAFAAFAVKKLYQGQR